MPTYPGNPALASDVRKRILEAFRHAIEAAADGNREQALLGCDFALRHDPDFAPALKLQQMIEQGRSPETIRALATELGDEPTAPGAASFTAAAPGLVATFSRLFAARKFGELLSAAQSQAAAVAGDSKLRELVSQAQERYDAEPFVREQLDRARRALGSGEFDDVAAAVARARDLDPSHPGLAEIERLRASAASMSSSLKIDWDEEDHAVPPPAELTPPAAAAPPASPTAASPPPPAAPASPSPPEPPATELGDPSFAGLDDLELPEIDFSSASAPPAFAPPSPAAADDEAAETSFRAPPSPPEDDLALPDLDDGALAAAADEGAAEAAEGDDGDGRVKALLDEGEVAFASGDYQAAIDAWSRIFLIDIDNEDAARRIERARQLKSEKEREVEEIFHQGVSHFDAGEWDAARDVFRRVLTEQPSYVLAREYLDKLEERVAEGAPPGALSELAPPELSTVEGGAAVPRRVGSEEILVPPDPGDRHEVAAPAVEGFAVKRKRGLRPTPAFLGIGGAVLVALGVGVWLLASNWSRLFPNAPAPAVSAAADAAAVVARAKKLHEDGRTAVAIAQLRRVPPQDSSFAEAQSLISQWERLSEKPAAGPDPRLAVRRDELVASADAAVDARDHFLARRLLAEAAAFAPLDSRGIELSAVVEQRAQQYADVFALLRDSEYERALNLLWRRHEADPADKDTRRLMVDAYYNLSVADLQRGDPSAARLKLREARNFDASDPLLDRLDRFCAAYEKREQDLLYRIFVKYLPAR
jgi:tetratricopeptide (TPR) repeat protein